MRPVLLQVRLLSSTAILTSLLAASTGCGVSRATQRVAGPGLIAGGLAVGAGASAAAFVGGASRCGYDGGVPCDNSALEPVLGIASIVAGIAMVTWGIVWTAEGYGEPEPSSESRLSMGQPVDLGGGYLAVPCQRDVGTSLSICLQSRER